MSLSVCAQGDFEQSGRFPDTSRPSPPVSQPDVSEAGLKTEDVGCRFLEVHETVDRALCPYHTITYHTILYYTILYYTILYYTILYYTILHYTTLYYTILYYTILYYTTLHYTILYYTILYYTILYYTRVKAGMDGWRVIFLHHSP